MNKHTLGPWIIETGADKLGPFCTISTQTDNPILHIIPLSAEGRVEFDAYVRLIAAAPDILEALKACFDVIDQVTAENMADYIGVDTVADVYQQARAAIAKAERKEYGNDTK